MDFASPKSMYLLKDVALRLYRALKLKTVAEPISISCEYDTEKGESWAACLQNYERALLGTNYTNFKKELNTEIRRQRILFRRF